MDEFFTWLGPQQSARLRLAVMDMWKPFRASTTRHAPQASILFDKFHVLRHLGAALDQVGKSEYAPLTGQDRRFIKGQKYTLLAHCENLTLDGRRALKTLLAEMVERHWDGIAAYCHPENKIALRPSCRWPASRSAWRTQFRMAWADGSNCRATASGVRPLRTSSVIRCRNSRAYGLWLFGIGGHSFLLPNDGVSTEAGQLHLTIAPYGGHARKSGG